MRKLILLVMSLLMAQSVMAADVVDSVLNGYRAEGASAFDGQRGEQMWTKTYMQEKLGKPVSCASCHTADLTRPGEHIRTGKVIEPLAVRANPERLTDPEKIEKWFTRNCKWTMGRECTAQEKGDFLLYIKNY